MLAGSTKDFDKQQLLWNALQQAFVEVARDAWQTENRNPLITLIGLHMILRAVENEFAAPRKKGQKHTLNLLDYLNSAAMDRLVASECADLLGINLDRAKIMLDAGVAVIRWTGRRGLLTEFEAAKAGMDMEKLMKEI